MANLLALGLTLLDFLNQEVQLVGFSEFLGASASLLQGGHLLNVGASNLFYLLFDGLFAVKGPGVLSGDAVVLALKHIDASLSLSLFVTREELVLVGCALLSKFALRCQVVVALEGDGAWYFQPVYEGIAALGIINFL